MKAKTIDEVCGQPHGSFQKFVEAQRRALQEIERERKERIRRLRNKQ